MKNMFSKKLSRVLFSFLLLFGTLSFDPLFTPSARAAFVNRGSLTLTCSTAQQTGNAMLPPAAGTSFPGCSVAVYVSGTNTLATLYYDNVGSGDSLANPFTVGTTTGVTGSTTQATFYADDGAYDVVEYGSSTTIFSNTTVATNMPATRTVGLRITNGSFNTSMTDGYFIVPPGACSWGSSGGTVTPSTSQGNQVSGNIPVMQIATTTSTETATLVCAINIPSRLTTGKGVTITGLNLIYGNSTGATATCNAPTVGSQTAPVAGTSETAASATLTASQGGTLTVTPVVGSCNTAAVSPGQVYTENVAFGTPFAVNTTNVTLYFTQSFVGPSSAAYTIYTAGLQVFYNNIPL